MNEINQKIAQLEKENQEMKIAIADFLKYLDSDENYNHPILMPSLMWMQVQMFRKIIEGK